MVGPASIGCSRLHVSLTLVQRVYIVLFFVVRVTQSCTANVNCSGFFVTWSCTASLHCFGSCVSHDLIPAALDLVQQVCIILGRVCAAQCPTVSALYAVLGCVCAAVSSSKCAVCCSGSRVCCTVSNSKCAVCCSVSCHTVSVSMHTFMDHVCHMMSSSSSSSSLPVTPAGI